MTASLACGLKDLQGAKTNQNCTITLRRLCYRLFFTQLQVIAANTGVAASWPFHQLQGLAELRQVGHVAGLETVGELLLDGGNRPEVFFAVVGGRLEDAGKHLLQGLFLLVLAIIANKNRFPILWGLICRKDLVKDCLDTPREIIESEDLLMQLKILMKHPRVFLINNIVYVYFS